MNNDDSVDKAHLQDQSLEEGSNNRFLNSHHAQYEEGDQDDQHVNNQDQSNDQSMDRYLAAMEDNHQNQNQVSEEIPTNPRVGRGNRGNRNVQVKQQNEKKEEQLQEPQEEKPQKIRENGRRNKMPNNLSDDEKQPQSSPRKVEIQKSQSNQKQPQQEKTQKKKGQDQKSEKEKQMKNSGSDSQDWDQSKDKIQAQNEQKPEVRIGRSGRGQPEAKQEQDNKVLDESNWQQEANNEKQKQEQKPSRKGGRNNDDDQEELKPDNDQSNWHQNQTSKQATEQNPKRGRGNRGNRQNRDENGQNGNQNEINPNGGRGRGNRGYNNQNNDYQNRPQFNRGENNYRRNNDNNQNRQRGGGNWRGGRGGYRGGFRGNQDRQNNGDNQQRGNRNFGRRNQNNHRQQENKSQNNQSSNFSNKSQVPVYDAVSIIQPKGIQSWPQVSLYIRKCKVSVTLRNINQHKADAVVFPFEDMNFRLYPSTLISQNSKYNFRKKIQEKFDQNYFKDRNCYPKKGQSIGNFNDVLFWKVQSKEDTDFKKFIVQLFKFMDLDKKSKSVVFPICKELGGFEVLLPSVIDCLHSLSNHNQGFIEKFQFTTKDPEYFKVAGKVFWENIVNHIDSNQIYIL